jgi:hydrogenase nickel incorporation protein HypA/HybF
MHEGSLIRRLVRQVNDLAAAEGASRVVGVEVSVGNLSHVTADHLREHFEHQVRGTLSEGAKLVVHRMDGYQDPLALEVVLDTIELEMHELDVPAHAGGFGAAQTAGHG